MISILQAFFMSIGVSFLVLFAVMVGGWLVFKSKAAPGERFIGPEPKGQVFMIPEAADAPDEVESVPARNSEFLSRLLGGKP
jgi:hypothetical protein